MQMMTWEQLYFGVQKDFESPSRLLNKLDSNEVIRIPSEFMADLYIAADESKESFLKLLKEIVREDILNAEETVKYWQKYFLDKILNSDKEIHQKLHDVADIWALFAYPSQWRSFIYYLPTNEKFETDENWLYKKFLEFYSNNFLNLDSNSSTSPSL